MDAGRRGRGRLPSPALVVAILALIVALAGTGYAAFRLPDGAVGTRQIRNGAVTDSKLAARSVSSSKIRPRAVTTTELADGSVAVAKLAAGAVSTSRLQDGSVTASKLAPGAITPAAVPVGAGVRLTYQYGTVLLAPGQALPAYAVCPSGSSVTGGGATADQVAVQINDSAPFNSTAGTWTGGYSDAWGVYATNTDTTQSHLVGIYAICIAHSS